MINSLSIIYIGTTAVFVITLLIAILWYRKKCDLSNLNNETEGNISKIITQKYKDPNDGKIKKMYTLTVTYNVNNQKYSTQMMVKEDNEDNNYQEGQSLTVLYDANSPKHSIVKEDKSPKSIWRYQFILTIVLIVISLIPLLLSMPYTMNFSKSQKNIFDLIRSIFLFIFVIIVFIVHLKVRKSKEKKDKDSLIPYIVLLAVCGMMIILNLYDIT